MSEVTFFKPAGPFTVAEVAEKLGLNVVGDATKPLFGVCALDDADDTQLSFLDNAKYKDHASATRAAAVILHPDMAGVLPKGVSALLSDEPYVAYAKALELFYTPRRRMANVSPEAVIDDEAFVESSAIVDPFAVVEAGARIGAHTHVGAGVFVGKNVVIGAHCTLHPHSSVTHTHMGDHCIVHSGCRIGQDGFGFAPSKTGVHKVPQIGRVLVGNHVEIGANATIDRGSLKDTVIGDHVKIDNLVQIAHNVVVGPHSMIVAQAGIAGSTTLGMGVVVGGQAGAAGHLTLADGVQLAGRAGVTKSIQTKGEVLGGFPAVPIKQWRKAQAKLSRLLRDDKK